ncbi:MAG TPA: sigma-70 family RNA polymerase sigma factor [Candidatus Limnocylindrales bacterium]|nr:sigma-70 family RNA polymerase sigma factor [Candidatus Limnocylindrales bacterium]
MQEVADMELLRQYAHRKSEEAFAVLVTRHVNVVYSAALRKTGNAHAAEEITQAVFIILAKKADRLRDGTILSGWLYQTARLTSASFLRTEIRRARREQEAYMQSLSNEPEARVWPEIEPLLEDAMGRLGEKERNALALRFFEGKSFQEIGAAMGASENAAKKRVSHGLEKLRKIFTKRGVSSTTAIIAGAISANSVQAAPVALAKSVTAVAIAKGAAASASTLTLIKGALKIMAWTKLKTAVTVGVVLLAGAATTKLMIHHEARKPNASSLPTSIQSKIDPDPFTNEGYQTPQAAVKTMLWAMHNGDWSSYVASSTPKQIDNLEHDKRGRTRGQLFAQAKNSVATVTGIQILDQKDISADEAVLTIHLDGEGKARVLGFKKIGNDWKFDQMIGVVLMPASPVNQ